MLIKTSALLFHARRQPPPPLSHDEKTAAHVEVLHPACCLLRWGNGPVRLLLWRCHRHNICKYKCPTQYGPGETEGPTGDRWSHEAGQNPWGLIDLDAAKSTRVGRPRAERAEERMSHETVAVVECEGEEKMLAWSRGWERGAWRLMV